jgi:hypothetical protein
MALPDGLYDLLLTEGLARSHAAIDPSSADVLALKGGAADFLADVMTRQLATILDDVSGDDADRAKRQLELVNELLVMLRQRLNARAGSSGASASAEVVDLVASPLRVPRAVQRDQRFPRRRRSAWPRPGFLPLARARRAFRASWRGCPLQLRN